MRSASAFRSFFAISAFALGLAVLAVPATAQQSGSLSQSPIRASSTVAADPGSPSRLVSYSEVPLDSVKGTDAGWQVVVTSNQPEFAITSGRLEVRGQPVRIKGLPAGKTAFTASRANCHDLDFTIDIRDGVQYRLTIELAPRTGVLVVDGDQPVQVLEIDGQALASGLPHTLIRGPHRVLARSFGYLDYDETVYVDEGLLLRIEIAFQPAPFRVDFPSASRPSFRPANPGRLGSTVLSFEASAPGTAHLEIRDPAGTLVASHDFPLFETWTQEFRWNGRDPDGAPLPEGDYAWTVVAVPAAAEEPAGTAALQQRSLAARVSIDNSGVIKYRPWFASGPGGALVGDTLVLPPLALQTDLRIGWAPSARTSGTDDALQLQAGLRIGLIKGLEAQVRAGGSFGLGSGGTYDAAVAAGLRWAALPLPPPGGAEPAFGLAVGLTGAIPAWDSPPLPWRAGSAGPIPGGQLAVGAQFRAGPFSVILEPSFILSPWAPTLSVGTAAAPAPHCFAILGSGIQLDFESVAFTLGASASTAETFIPALPVRVSLGAQAMPLDELALYLEASCAIDTAGPSGWAFACGVGLIQ